MADYNDDNSETSRFNEASLQIMRLNDFWIRAESYATTGQLTKWKFLLDAVWRELSADVEKMSDASKIRNINNYLLKKIASSRSNKNALYFYLGKRHEYLKNLQEKSGKGSSYESSVEHDFD